MEEGTCPRCGFRFAAEDLIECQLSTQEPSGQTTWSAALLCPDCYQREKNVSRVRHRAPPHLATHDPAPVDAES